MSAESMKIWRKKKPMHAAYLTLKANAKRRGIEFTITLEYFEKFCIETRLMKKRGKTKHSYSVDRIDVNKGYVPGNLQMLTLAKNSSKMHVDKQYKFISGEGQAPDGLKIVTKEIDETEETPF